MEIALFGKNFVERMHCLEGPLHCCAYLKKGDRHQTCDDAALIYEDAPSGYALFAIFDGVSGESYGYEAAEIALEEVKSFVSKNFGRVKNEELLLLALDEANFKISRGATTASVALVLTNGDYYFSNIGDSHIYKTSQGKAERLTKDEKDAAGTGFHEYISTRRNLVQCLGGRMGNAYSGKGKLNHGDSLFAASDGVCDNLYIEREGGVVMDTSGVHDLEAIIKGKKDAKTILEALVAEIKRRMELKEEEISDNGILVPKSDDFSIAILKY